MKDYTQKYKKSIEAYKKAFSLMPGGVNSPVRAFGGVDLNPIFISKAVGSKIYDIDGNGYIDYVCSWGPMILGHCREEVVKAVKNALERGCSFGAPTEAESELAEKISNSFGSIDKVRLVNSGTEAAMTAIRLAKGFTGREILIKMAGCYHGHSDSLLASGGSGLAENSIPSSPGVPEDLAKLTVVVPYNDTKALCKAFEMHKGNVAGVIIEPAAANMGVIKPEPGYLQLTRELCDKNGSILIFDEVITGFRLSRSGGQGYYGVDADLTCLGKIVGGGLPLAAFGGKAEIMNRLAPIGDIYQAGTLSGNPLATAAANATLDILLSDKNIYADLEKKGRYLQEGLELSAKEENIPITINRVGSLMSCFFTGNAVKNFEDVKKTDISRFKRFFAEMINRGIYLAPSAFEAMFISTAHSMEDLDKTIKAAKDSFQAIRR